LPHPWDYVSGPLPVVHEFLHHIPKVYQGGFVIGHLIRTGHVTLALVHAILAGLLRQIINAALYLRLGYTIKQIRFKRMRLYMPTFVCN
jgi:hypothetical protein